MTSSVTVHIVDMREILLPEAKVCVKRLLHVNRNKGILELKPVRYCNTGEINNKFLELVNKTLYKMPTYVRSYICHISDSDI